MRGLGRTPIAATVATLLLFAAFAALRLAREPVPLPNPLTVTLELADAELPRADPLIVAGEPGAGDFLVVWRDDPHTVTFAYDSWGQPALVSAPVRLPPGRPLALRVSLPALAQTRPDRAPASNRVRVEVDGRTVLDAPGHYFPRDPDRLYFGVNPVGGTACGLSLRGRLVAANGREWRGALLAQTRPDLQPDQGFSRFAAWVYDEPGAAAALLLISAGLTLAGVRWGRRLAPAALARALGEHRWFAGAALVATAGFAWLVTFGTFRFDAREPFGNFYDHQAASLLAGRLDVPEEAIGGEAFEARGKLYGYFGPTPALLRLPFVAGGVGFGQLSRAYLVAYFAASLLAAYLILRDAWRGAGRPGEPSAAGPPTPWATVVLVASAGWGSTLFFLGSRALVFHEAILGGVAFALWSVWGTLRHWREPGGRWWIGALVCGLLSIHTRPTTGLYALTVLGVISALLVWRPGRAAGGGATRPGLGPRLRHLAIGAGCVAGALSLHGLAYLKFGVFEAAPLRISRPYLGTDRLDHIAGRSFHLANLPYGFHTYVARPNLRVGPRFPWLYHGPRLPESRFPHARIDLPDDTVALPYAMPSLFALATAGGALAWATAPGLRVALAALWLGALPMTLALLAAVATAQRYTGDFCPLLIAAAALGLVGAERLPVRSRTAVRALLAFLTVAAVAVSAALTLHYQGETLWGVPEEARQKYQHLRVSVVGWLGVAP